MFSKRRAQVYWNIWFFILYMQRKQNVFEKEEELVAIATSYRRQIFELANLEDIEETLSEVSTTTMETKNADLTAPVTKWKVKLVLFAMHLEKAPGPEEMTVIFYRKF